MNDVRDILELRGADDAGSAGTSGGRKSFKKVTTSK
jgi:hypothetical protein